MTRFAEEFVVVQVVPTGIGAEIGGYVGDATPATNAIAGAADVVISHPNVVNGVTLNAAEENVFYVEGYSLDRFFRDQIALRPIVSNRIGVVLDVAGKGTKGYDLAINTIETMRTVKGVEIVEYTETQRSVNVKAVKTKAGAFVGEVKDPRIFLRPCLKLVREGAEAIAIATHIDVKDKDLKLYFKGKGPNPYGGAEAVISHAVSRRFGVPCAHAPILSAEEIKKEMFSGKVDPRAAAEAIGPAYLGSVLQGLSDAPHLVPFEKSHDDDIFLADVNAVVLPYNCMGGIPALAAQKQNIPIIAVKENKTLMQVPPKKLNLENVIVVDNYLEVIGIVTAMKEGIDFRMIRRPVKKLKKI